MRRMLVAIGPGRHARRRPNAEVRAFTDQAAEIATLPDTPGGSESGVPGGRAEDEVSSCPTYRSAGDARQVGARGSIDDRETGSDGTCSRRSRSSAAGRSGMRAGRAREAAMLDSKAWASGYRNLASWQRRLTAKAEVAIGERAQYATRSAVALPPRCRRPARPDWGRAEGDADDVRGRSWSTAAAGAEQRARPSAGSSRWDVGDRGGAPLDGRIPESGPDGWPVRATRYGPCRGDFWPATRERHRRCEEAGKSPHDGDAALFIRSCDRHSARSRRGGRDAERWLRERAST